MDLITPPRVVELSEATQANVRRIVSLWSELLARFEPRRTSLLVPTGDGRRVVRRGRFWTTAGRYDREPEAGFHPIPDEGS